MEDHKRLVDNIDTGQSRNETRKIVLHLFSLFTVLEPLKRTCTSFEDQKVSICTNSPGQVIYYENTVDLLQPTMAKHPGASRDGGQVVSVSPSTLTILLKSAVLCFVKLCEKNENKLKRQET